MASQAIFSRKPKTQFPVYVIFNHWEALIEAIPGFIRTLSGKRGLRLSIKSIAYSDRHIHVPGQGLNFSDLPLRV